MKRFLILLIVSFFSFQSYAGSCPDGSDPVRSVSADGTYFVYNCGGSSNDASSSTNSSSTASTSSSNNSSSGIVTYPETSEIPWSANPNYETLKYYLYMYLYHNGNIGREGHRLWEVKASNNPYNLKYDLREDKYIKQQMQETALLSYQLYEDGKIVIDEITPKDRFGDMFTDSSKYGSASLGKSLVSYVTGHAICAGYIDSVDSRLDDWPLIQNTLYHNQKLINLLNMSAGDQDYATINGLTNSSRWINSPSVQSIMEQELNGSKKTYSQYNYNNLATNTIGTYVVFKSGDSFQDLLDNIFKKKARIKDDVFFLKNPDAKFGEETFWYHFFATRSDYLRIAKAMLDDWQNDTCEGQYLKTIYKKRINRNESLKDNTNSYFNPQNYGGQYHMGYQGMKNRPVMGMNGFGDQSILIDFERGRIVATQAIHANYNWSRLVHEPIRDGKPASISTTEVKQPAKPAIDPQQLILDNEAKQEAERKARQFWDDYYAKIFGEASADWLDYDDWLGLDNWESSADGLILLSEDFENLDQRDLLTDDRDDTWHVKQDIDGNSTYCNKKVTTDDYAAFNLGNENWRDYSISYRMKFATDKGGELETHIRKNSNRQGEYRSVINSVTGNNYLKYVKGKGAERINKKIAYGSRSAIRDQWADIQLIATGNYIEFHVNGKVVSYTEDDRLEKGAAMFAVTSHSEVCIDDIVIKKESEAKDL
jgi:CubicO group peptidase (beta-lactamase class C family)